MKHTSKMFRALFSAGGIQFILGFAVVVFTSQAFAQGDTWETKTSRVTATATSSAGVIDGILYVVGGAGPINVVEAYDPVSDTWTTKPPIPTARGSAASGVIDGKLYVVGGGNPFDISQVDIYDPVANSWSTASNPMLDPRSGVAAGVIDGILYVVGGDVFGQNASVNTLRAYNPVTDTWVLKASMPTVPRQRVAVGVIDGKIYAVGGFSTCCAPLTTLEVYDPVSDTWTTAAPLPAGKDGLVGGVIGGKLYAVTGLTPGPTPANIPSNETFEYDPTTDAWVSRSPIPTARFAASAGVIDGKLYVVGGGTLSGSTAVLEVYTPPITAATLDSDDDGVLDDDDFCPGTASVADVDANGCSDAQVDGDGDGICDPGAPSDGPSSCTGTDNCPADVNPGQADNDDDGTGNACDDCLNDFGPPDNAGCSRPEVPPGTVVENLPSGCDIVVDGQFGSNACIEWGDITPVVTLGGDCVIYQALDPDGGDIYLMYDCTISATPLRVGEESGVVRFFVGDDVFDVFFIQGGVSSTGGAGDGVRVLKNGQPFDDALGSIVGAVDFNSTSPNFPQRHNLFELEVVLVQTPETPGGSLPGDGGLYSPDPAFWGARLPGSPLVQVSSIIIDIGAGGNVAANVLKFTVAIDIKPGSDPNSINCTNPKEVIAVAILTTPSFDATTVDHTTVTFEGASETHVDKKTGVARRHEEDVDGDTDLVFHFRFADTNIECGDEQARLTGETFDGLPIEGSDAINTVGDGGKKALAPEVEEEAAVPEVYALYQNYPNPFNPTTTIAFDVPALHQVELAVYDVMGRRVATLVDGVLAAGRHEATWLAGKLPSGTYFYRLTAGPFSQTKAMALLK